MVNQYITLLEYSFYSILNVVREEVLKWQTTSLGLRRGTGTVLEEVVRKASGNLQLKAELNAVGLVHRDTHEEDNSTLKLTSRKAKNVSILHEEVFLV